jgi:hypothetical protein
LDLNLTLAGVGGRDLDDREVIGLGHSNRSLDEMNLTTGGHG